MGERWTVAVGVEVNVFYPDRCYAATDAVADLAGTDLVDAVRAAWPLPVHSTALTRPGDPSPRFPLASLIVSADPEAQFDPDLSNPEPLEIQVWPDGSLTVEVEFTNADIRVAPHARDAIRQVLSGWAEDNGSEVLTVFNDRGRSLPDVWNARFTVPDPGVLIGAIVDFAYRAIESAEALHTPGAVLMV
jgi:hypothetical protein